MSFRELADVVVWKYIELFSDRKWLNNRSYEKGSLKCKVGLEIRGYYGKIQDLVSH